MINEEKIIFEAFHFTTLLLQQVNFNTVFFHLLQTILTHDTARLVDNEGKTVMHTAAEQG